ncbi:hypothetical protein [Streptomyces sp. NPDC056661]|uniref:hypothetical protein n=1 Tax=Streptomyces sp. NPDC056661 TaxID=3345898 RepID=UPI0036A11228
MAALEQEWHGWAPDLLEDVVGGHERQRCLSGADPEDDGGEGLAEFRGDQEEAFTVGFRRAIWSMGTTSPVVGKL